MPAPAIRTETYAAPRLRSSTMCSGSSGCAARRCQSTNATISTPAAASKPQVSGELQPSVSAFEKP